MNISKSSKILFVMRSVTTFHYSESIIAELCQRGHRVHAIFDLNRSQKLRYNLNRVQEWQKKFPAFSYDFDPFKEWNWQRIMIPLWDIMNYRRYLLVPEQSRHFLERSAKRLPQRIRNVAGQKWFCALLCARISGFLLGIIDKIIPPDRSLLVQLRTLGPDCVVVTPGNERTPTSDSMYLKAAIRLKIPTVLQVLSWDNLTTKGLIHEKPDRVLAWNEAQIDEAWRHHGIARGSIRIVGATLFDDMWFVLRSLPTREEFCAAHGLRPEDPIVTYLVSASNVTPDDSDLIKSMLEDLTKSSDPRLRRTQLVVRPHPGKYEIYAKLKYPNLTVIPKVETMGYLSYEADADLFSATLMHSLATVGIYTTGMHDAVIVDRPTLAYIQEKLRQTQEDTEHFQLAARSGAWELVRGPDEFIKSLTDLLDGEDPRKMLRQNFVDKYVRPRGRDVPAGRWAALEIEALLGERSGVTSQVSGAF